MSRALFFKIAVFVIIALLVIAPSGDRFNIPATCDEAPCIFRDKYGYAGLRVAEGDYRSIGGIVVDLREDGNIIDIRGRRVEDLTGLETAIWTSIDIYIESAPYVACHGDEEYDLRDFNRLIEIQPEQIGKSMEVCIFLNSITS